MYRNKFDDELKDETKFTKKIIIWVCGFLFIISGVIWFFTRSAQVAENAFVNYEQFQEIYNTCAKINTDIGVIRAVDEDDKMFEAFSKQAMIANKKQQLTRWVEEYNAKSKMWNRALWKSNSLPYQLTTNEFSNWSE